MSYNPHLTVNMILTTQLMEQIGYAIAMKESIKAQLYYQFQKHAIKSSIHIY